MSLLCAGLQQAVPVLGNFVSDPGDPHCLEVQFSIDTTGESTSNLRVAQVPLYSEPDRFVVVIGTVKHPEDDVDDDAHLFDEVGDGIGGKTLIYDRDNTLLSRTVGFNGDVWGLTCIPSCSPLSDFPSPRIVAGCEDTSQLRISDFDGNVLGDFESPPKSCFWIEYEPEWSNDLFVTGRHSGSNSVSDGAFCQFDLVSLRKVQDFGHHMRDVNSVAISCEKNLLYSVSDDGTARVWSRRGDSGSVVQQGQRNTECLSTWDLGDEGGRKFTDTSKQGNCCFLHEESNSLFVGMGDQRIQHFDIRMNARVQIFVLGNSRYSPIYQIAQVAEDRFASISESGLVSLWTSPATGEELKLLGERTIPVRCFGFCAMRYDWFDDVEDFSVVGEKLEFLMVTQREGGDYQTAEIRVGERREVIQCWVSFLL